MRLPSADELRDLIAWAPPFGAISVYLDIDPADRGGGWHTELKDALHEIAAEVKATGERERFAAVEATVEAILERFPLDAPHRNGRVQIGFAEAGVKERDGRWWGAQLSPDRTRIAYGARPFVRPLVELLDRGRPRAVAALSADKVRLFEWRLGTLEEIDSRELELLSLDWRERKGPRMRDPASGQAVTSAGRDQFDQRLEENRKRFLKECGAKAAHEFSEDARRELICLGEPPLAEAFVAGWDQKPRRCDVDGHDVIAEPLGAIGERVSAKLEQLEEQRVEELVTAAIDASLAPEGRGALGPSNAIRALLRGQVDHLVVDAEREIDAGAVDSGVLAELEAATPRPGARLDEWMVEEAILTGAGVTHVRSAAAERLAEHGGVGAILRY
jgi:hypothetical protein